jgi:hypothetical protein
MASCDFQEILVTRHEQGHALSDQLTMDLLSKPGIKSFWIPRMFCGKERWKVISGTWRSQDIRGTFLLQEHQAAVENIAVIGSRRWRDYRFDVSLEIVSDSVKPPEGGAILYYQIKNPVNFHSLHICIAKRKLELIRRRGTVWTTIAERVFPVTKFRRYRIGVSTCRGQHQVTIDGDTLLECQEPEDSCGYVGVGTKYCDLLFTDAQLSLISAPPASEGSAEPGER